MARINLLPWRTERRKQREREFYMLLIASAVAAWLRCSCWSAGWAARIDNQHERNTYLQTEIKGLDKQIEEIKELDKTQLAAAHAQADHRAAAVEPLADGAPVRRTGEDDS